MLLIKATFSLFPGGANETAQAFIELKSTPEPSSDSSEFSESGSKVRQSSPTANRTLHNIAQLAQD